MKIPSVAEAEALLADGSRRNPGLWVQHSAVAAATAGAIAEHHPVLDPDAAYVLGLLHDIGRSTGGPQVPDVRHLLDGYQLMLDRGFDDLARICLTHSFPIKQADAFASRRVIIITTIHTQRPTLLYGGLLLSRLNRVHWPTLIPALTPSASRHRDRR